MLVGALQFAPEFGSPAKNVAHASELILEHRPELVVLPELCTTGYVFEDRAEAWSLSEPVPDGPSTRSLLALAKETKAHVCFGIAEREEDRLFNSCALVGPDGLLLVYRKVHLFLDEKDVFDPGDLGFPVADLAGGRARVGAMICFDWIFPEAARALSLAGAEILLHPSNLVLPYCQGAMRTRSLENGVFSVTSNRTGEEERGGRDRLTFTGQSQVVSPTGEVLGSLGATEDGIALAEISPESARDKSVTPRNSLFEDRRPDTYGILVDDDVER